MGSGAAIMAHLEAQLANAPQVSRPRRRLQQKELSVPPFVSLDNQHSRGRPWKH